MEFLIIPLALAIMMVLGVIVGRLSLSYKKIGRFIINKDDPKEPAFWLELKYDLDVIEKQSICGLEVVFHTKPPE